MTNIKITHALWSGWQRFSYHSKVPFIGIGKEKIKDKEIVNLELALNPNEDSQSFKLDVPKLVEMAERNNWLGLNGRLACYYLPITMLDSLIKRG